MTANESLALKIGDRVLFVGSDPNDLGTVIDTGYAGVTISWDIGQVSRIDHVDMQSVTFGPSFHCWRYLPCRDDDEVAASERCGECGGSRQDHEAHT